MTIRIQQQLETSPRSFSFEQLIRLLPRFVKSFDTDVQFKVNPSRRFPVKEIEALNIVDANTPEKQYTLVVNFMGLVGHDGIMPAHINELILQRLQNKDSTLIEFLNLFHNHLLQLYSELLCSRRFYINAEQQKSDITLETLRNITGQVVSQSDNNLYYAGLFAHQARSAEGLQTMLASYFELPIIVSQYTPSWFNLDKSDITVLNSAGKQQAVLGDSAMLGNRVWHVQNQFTIWIGPLNFKIFKQFLPEGKYLNQLTQLARDYIGLEYDFTVQLLLARESIPVCKLRYKKSEQLGWTSWLNGSSTANDYSMVTLPPRENGGVVC